VIVAADRGIVLINTAFVEDLVKDHDSVRRIQSPELEVRLYEIVRGSTRWWVAWLDAKRVVLPGDPNPVREMSITTNSARATAEPLFMEPGVTEPEQRTIPVAGGRGTISISLTPVFVVPTP
jgi:hypothetical protein